MAFTYFFRDQHTLDLIASQVLPTLMRHTYIDVWDAGCAMGPEPYSLAMTLRENMGPFMFRNVRMCATDIDERGDFGTVIARGIYSERRVKRIPAALLAKYFTRRPGSSEPCYQVREELRRVIRFKRHDLLSLQPAGQNFGLIVCKNVLLHVTPAERGAIIQMFHAALAPDGFLVMEQTQKLPADVAPLFERVTSAGQVFQKHSVATADPPRLHGDGAAITVMRDQAFSKVSSYTWFNVEVQGQRVGKVRVHIEERHGQPPHLQIYSLNIFPEFQGRGWATQVVTEFQHALCGHCS